MLRFLVRRLLLTIPVLLGVATLVFALLHLVPGDPAQVMLGEAAAASDVEALRQKLGLDRPWPAQYVQFIGGLVQGETTGAHCATAFLTKSTRAMRPARAE